MCFATAHLRIMKPPTTAAKRTVCAFPPPYAWPLKHAARIPRIRAALALTTQLRAPCSLLGFVGVRWQAARCLFCAYSRGAVTAVSWLAFKHMGWSPSVDRDSSNMAPVRLPISVRHVRRAVISHGRFSWAAPVSLSRSAERLRGLVGARRSPALAALGCPSTSHRRVRRGDSVFPRSFLLLRG
jgi:hypothetical protein